MLVAQRHPTIRRENTSVVADDDDGAHRLPASDTLIAAAQTAMADSGRAGLPGLIDKRNGDREAFEQARRDRCDEPPDVADHRCSATVPEFWNPTRTDGRHAAARLII